MATGIATGTSAFCLLLTTYFLTKQTNNDNTRYYETKRDAVESGMISTLMLPVAGYFFYKYFYPSTSAEFDQKETINK